MYVMVLFVLVFIVTIKRKYYIWKDETLTMMMLGPLVFFQGFRFFIDPYLKIMMQPIILYSRWSSIGFCLMVWSIVQSQSKSMPRTHPLCIGLTCCGTRGWGDDGEVYQRGNYEKILKYTKTSTLYISPKIHAISQEGLVHLHFICFEPNYPPHLYAGVIRMCTSHPLEPKHTRDLFETFPFFFIRKSLYCKPPVIFLGLQVAKARHCIRLP